jgi:hypothetical protein
LALSFSEGVGVRDIRSASLSIDILCESPQYTRWIEQAKVSHSPRLRFNIGYPNFILLDYFAAGDVLPPRVHIFNEDVHHEVLG